MDTVIVQALSEDPPCLQERQVVVTQTLSNPGSTWTALVTLGNSSPTTTAAGSGSGSGADSGSSGNSGNGLSAADIGIIVGCCLGAVFILLCIWCCMAFAARRRTRYYTSEISVDYTTSTDTVVSEVDSGRVRRPRPVRPHGPPQYPQWTYRPPPVVPNYRARPIGNRWTANRAGMRGV